MTTPAVPSLSLLSGSNSSDCHVIQIDSKDDTTTEPGLIINETSMPAPSAPPLPFHFGLPGVALGTIVITESNHPAHKAARAALRSPSMIVNGDDGGKGKGGRGSSPVGGRYFSELQSDLMTTMASYLDARSLFCLASVNRRWSGIASERKLWTKLLLNDFADRIPRFRPKVEYRQRIERRQNEARARLLAAEREASEKRRQRFGYLCHVFVDPCFPLIIGVLSFIFIVLMSVQLQNNIPSSGDPHESYVTMWSVWPLLAIVVYIFVASCIVCYAKFMPNPWPLPRSFYDDTRSVVRFFTKEVFDDGDGDRGLPCVSFCLWLMAFAAFVILVALKISNYLPDSITWVKVFIPLWIFCVWYCFSPCFRWLDDSDRYPVMITSYLAVGVPLVIFSALLLWRLDGGSISIAKIFAPLWVMDAMIFIGMIVMSIKESPVILLGWLCTFQSFFLFKLFLSLYLDSGNTAFNFIKAFSPLYIVFGITAIGSLSIGMVLCCDNRRRW